jgi:hypothetical protein
MDVSFSAALGNLSVQVTNNRGFTPEELADQALDKILYVGENVHPVIRDQAVAFKEQIRSILIQYMKRAVASERTTVIAKLKAHGHADLAHLLEG